MQAKSKAGDEKRDLSSLEFLQGKDLSGQIDWGRPPVPKIDESEDAIEFMQIDCDYYTERPKRELQIGKWEL